MRKIILVMSLSMAWVACASREPIGPGGYAPALECEPVPSPEVTADFVGDLPRLNWQWPAWVAPGYAADRYWIQRVQSPAEHWIVLDEFALADGVGSPYVFPAPLAAGSTTFWRVAPEVGAIGEGCYALSDVVSIVTPMPTPHLTYAVLPDPAKFAVGGMKETLADVQFSAQHARWEVTKLRVRFPNAVVTGASLYVGPYLIAGPVTPVLSGGAYVADFTGLNAFSVPKNGSNTLTIKGDIRAIGPGGGDPGTPVQVVLCGGGTGTCAGDAGTWEAKAYEPTNVLIQTATVGESGDAAGTAKRAYKSYPTLSTPSPATTVANGTQQILYRWDVKSHAAGATGFKSVAFDVTMTGTLTASSWTIWDVALNTQVFGTVPASCSAGPCRIHIGFVSFGERAVPAGQTRSFQLRATVSGADPGESIQTAWVPDTQHSVGELHGIGAMGIDGNGPVAAYNFIWSDRSAAGHNDQVGSIAGTDEATPSNDWVGTLDLPTPAPQTVVR